MTENESFYNSSVNSLRAVKIKPPNKKLTRNFRKFSMDLVNQSNNTSTKENNGKFVPYQQHTKEASN